MSPFGAIGAGADGAWGGCFWICPSAGGAGRTRTVGMRTMWQAATETLPGFPQRGGVSAAPRRSVSDSTQPERQRVHTMATSAHHDPDRRPRALFIIGGWEGHEPRQTTERIAPLIAEAGFEVSVTESLSALDDPDRLRRARVIVPCWTMGELTGEQERNLCTAVRGGVGLAGWHGGMGDAFRKNTNYQFMVGGQFVAHPGNMIAYRIDIAHREHPITRGLPASFMMHDTEQYYMHIDPSNEVLAETMFTGQHGDTPWVRGVRMPVLWTRPWGEGRVAYCSIGHRASDFDQEPVREIVRRCVLWAAKAENLLETPVQGMSTAAPK